MFDLIIFAFEARLTSQRQSYKASPGGGGAHTLVFFYLMGTSRAGLERALPTATGQMGIRKTTTASWLCVLLNPSLLPASAARGARKWLGEKDGKREGRERDK